jgi:hypothetical protein
MERETYAILPRPMRNRPRHPTLEEQALNGLISITGPTVFQEMSSNLSMNPHRRTEQAQR